MASTIFLVTIMLALFCHTRADFSPRSSKPDVVAQAKIAAQKSKAAIQATVQIAKKYTKGSTKAQAESCIVSLDDAINLVNQCLDVLKAFNPGRKGDVQNWSSTATDDLDGCLADFDEFQSSGPADLEKAIMKAYNIHRSFVKLADRV